MNPNEYDELEKELKCLTPKQIHKSIGKKIEETIDLKKIEKKAKAIQLAIKIVPIAIAACLGFVLGLFFFNSAKKDTLKFAEKQELKLPLLESLPAANKSNLFLGSWDDGIVYLENEIPKKRIRNQFLETFKWEDSKNSMKIEVRKPREEIIHVRLQHY